MSTAFTHAFVGVSLGQCLPAGVPKKKLVFFLMLASIAPDLDAIGYFLGVPYEHAMGHRGFTHSLFFALVSAPILMMILLSREHWCKRAGVLVSVLFFLSIASHGVIDALTDKGLGIGFWIPFSTERYFFSWRPLIAPPISITGFFRYHAIATLRGEFLVVWMPLIALSVPVFLFRRFRGRDGAGEVPEE